MRERRRYLSKPAKARIIERQAGLCAACGCDLKQERVEFDHVLPLALGGSNDEPNFEALHRSCHRQKTDADVARIAKAKRQERYHNTGRSRARKGKPMPSRPFQGWRAFNGDIRRP